MFRNLFQNILVDSELIVVNFGFDTREGSTYSFPLFLRYKKLRDRGFYLENLVFMRPVEEDEFKGFLFYPQ